MWRKSDWFVMIKEDDYKFYNNITPPCDIKTDWFSHNTRKKSNYMFIILNIDCIGVSLATDVTSYRQSTS